MAFHKSAPPSSTMSMLSLVFRREKITKTTCQNQGAEETVGENMRANNHQAAQSQTWCLSILTELTASPSPSTMNMSSPGPTRVNLGQFTPANPRLDFGAQAPGSRRLFTRDPLPCQDFLRPSPGSRTLAAIHRAVCAGSMPPQPGFGIGPP